MRHQWRPHRTFRDQSDGQRRCDQAYQFLLQWAGQQPATAAASGPGVVGGCSHALEETAHASSTLRAGLDPPPSPDPDH